MRPKLLGRTSVRSLATPALIALLAVAVGLWSQNTAIAQPCSGNNCNVTTQAHLGGPSGVPMTIECKWEMADASPNDTAMTYGQDDTPSVLADGPACDPISQPTAASGRHHMIGLLPNAADQPVLRQYEKWVAVSSATIGDIVDVYWKVWEPYVVLPPNGTNCEPYYFLVGGVQTPFCFKYQHHATANLGPPATGNALGSGGTMFSNGLGNCHDLQVAPMTDMFNAAVATGEMTTAEAANIVAECFQQEKAVFRVQETVSKDQPYGEYRVEVTVVNSAGGTFKNVDYFDVVPFIYINKDFTSVDWQTITNGATTIVSGDMNMETPGPAKADLSGVKPTIENTGNQEMYVSVHFNPLVFAGDPTKSIVHFDAKFRAAWQTNPATTQTFDPMYASATPGGGDWRCFNNHPLGSDGSGKIDLSVHPDAAQAGTYTGSIDILGTGGHCPP